MKIYKIIANQKPKWCMQCPLFTMMSIRHECGTFKATESGEGWQNGGTAPDERCKIEVKGDVK